MERQTHRDGGPAFWIGAALGWTVIVLGVRAELNDRDLRPMQLARWVAGGLVLHDGVWLAAVGAVLAALVAVLRRPVPTWLGWAAGTTAVLLLVGLPFIRG